MSRKVIIIGAGVAGLTAGIYAQRSGFDVTILEQHTIPGGTCTSWRRKGYLFEGAVHWLTGSSPKTELYKLWRDVGALGDGIKVHYEEPFASLEWKERTICLYRNLTKLKEHFLEISPEDKKPIERLVSDIKTLAKMQMPIMDVKGVKIENPSRMSIRSLLKMLPALQKMKKLGKLSAVEYTSQFKHPGVRLALGIVPEGYGATSLLFTLATLAEGDGGYPEGGSLAMTQRMADTFTSLGGEIQFGVKAQKVVVQNGAATGVSVDGKTIEADAVIVTQETIAAAEQLFETPPKDEWLVKLKKDTKPVTCCFICIGINERLPSTPGFELKEPIRFGDFSYSMLSFYNYTNFPEYAPEGATVLTTALMGDSYDFWKRARDEGRYDAEKQALAEQIEQALTEKYPQVKDKIEVIDVSTPLTYERYTGASRGSWMSVMGKGDSAAGGMLPCTLENAKGVYFAGHRTMMPGGLPVALMSGRRAAQMVCKQFDVVFK